MSLLVSLLLATQVVSTNPGKLLLNAGEPAPPFAMRDLERKPFSIRALTGSRATDPQKAVMLVFFATWCKPCKKEIPVIKEIYSEWKDKGVSIAYIGLSQNAKELKPFNEVENFPWPVVPDSFGLLGRRYGVRELPHLFIINSRGNIAFQHRGTTPELKTILHSQLSRITGIGEITSQETTVITERFNQNLTFGRTPAIANSAARWQSLASFVGEAINASVETVEAKDYEEFKTNLITGKYDIVNVGPLMAIKAEDKYEPAARLERLGTTNYFGIIFTMNKRIKSLKDLNGRTIAMVSPNSTSGGLFPQKTLLDAGLVPGQDIRIKWVKSHPGVAAAVLKGNVAAGACFEDCRDHAWKSAAQKSAQTRILSYTDEIPGELILIKRTLPAEIKAQLKARLLSISEDSGILRQLSIGELPITAILPADENALAVVKKVLREVNEKTK